MPLAVGWALALIVIALFCGLGTWQLGRAKQKEAMLAASQKILSERRAVPLGDAARPASGGIEVIRLFSHARRLSAPAAGGGRGGSPPAR